MLRRSTLRAAGGAALALVAGCRSRRRPDDDGRLVFAHQPLWGDAAPLRGLLDAFARERSGLRVESLVLPNASDVAHQYFLTALEGGSTDFDLLVADVVWIAELARAGWIAPLSDVAPAAALRAEIVAGAVESAVHDGETWAIPWYMDVGLLYRRADLVPDAPATYEALDEAARAARAARPSLAGYVFQGKQYEGLVCNAYELVWGFGGATMDGDRLALATEPFRLALARLRDVVDRGVAPAAVRSMAEEEARRAFQAGRAVFMRKTVSPLFLLVRTLGLRDELAGLVLPSTGFALPLAIWVLTDFFATVPDDLYRAARVDGCSPAGALVRVFVPVSAPALATTAILVFVQAWNELLFALTFTTSPERRTVPVAIAMFAAEHREPWGEIAAASVVATLPLLLVTLLFHRRVVAGLTAGAVKG